MSKLILVVLLIFGVPTMAHEGHDHGPGQVPLQKGGVMRSLETVNLELVYKDKSVAIYPFEVKLDPKTPGKLTPAEIGRFSVSAKVGMPRAKAQSVGLKAEGDHWTATVDPKGAHRFKFILSFTEGEKVNEVVWTVEPKR